jgi:hypothetical protein
MKSEEISFIEFKLQKEFTKYCTLSKLELIQEHRSNSEANYRFCKKGDIFRGSHFFILLRKLPVETDCSVKPTQANASLLAGFGRKK